MLCLMAGASSPGESLVATLRGHSGAAVPSLCPSLCQVTLETDTLAPTAPQAGVRVTAWTAELAGAQARLAAGLAPIPAPRRGPELPPVPT